MAANGKLPTDELVAVQGDITLPTGAAAAWLTLEAEVAATFGVNLNISAPGGGYRPFDMQVDMRANPTKYGARPGKVAAAGYSVHGRLPGSIDIYNHAAIPRKSLVAIAKKHGLIADRVPNEPWHFEYDGVTGGGGSGFTPTVQEDDMSTMLRLFYTQNSKTEQTLFVGPGNVDALRHPIYSRVWIGAAHAPTPYPNLIGDLSSADVVSLAGPSRLITTDQAAKMSKRTGRLATFAQLAAALAAAGEDGSDSGFPDLAALVKGAIDDAFEDIEIPTPSISAADKQQIIDGAGEKALARLRGAIAEG